MVIRKYSVGHPDNAQQKVQFVKLYTYRGISYFDANQHVSPQDGLLALDYLHYEERLMQFAFFTHLFLHPLYLDCQHFL